jgi:hypothetical protein
MAVIGNIIPEITKFLIDFEEYDYPESATKQEIIRNYISYMTNLTIFTILAYRGLYNIAFIDRIFGTNFASTETDDSKRLCRYDHAGNQLIALLFSEIGTQFALEFAKAFARRVFFVSILGRNEWKQDIKEKLGDYAIWMLYC